MESHGFRSLLSAASDTEQPAEKKPKKGYKVPEETQRLIDQDTANQAPWKECLQETGDTIKVKLLYRGNRHSFTPVACEKVEIKVTRGQHREKSPLLTLGLEESRNFIQKLIV